MLLCPILSIFAFLCSGQAWNSAGLKIKTGHMKRKATQTKATTAKKVKVELRVETREEIPHAQVFGYGGGEVSQLTNQYPSEKKFPAPLEQFSDVQSAGYHTALLLKENGKPALYTWGCNDDGVLGRVTEDEQEGDAAKVELENVVKIAVGDYHMCALTKEGQLYGWGSYKDEEGFLGLHTALARKERRKTPLEFDFPEIRDYKIVDVASSCNSTVVLTSSGHIYQWGCTKQILPKKSSRLAEKSDRDQLRPHHVYLPASQKAKRVFSGGNHHFVLCTNGSLWGWGINGYGQIGSGDARPHERPKKVPGVSDVVDVSCGVCHTLILTADGTVYSLGRNAYGQLGIGDDEKMENTVEARPSKSKPQRISWFEDNLQKGDEVVQVYAGAHHSAAVTKNGEVYAWGFADANRLGIGSEEDQSVPHKVGGKWAETRLAKRISCGSDFGIIVTVKKD